MTTRRMGAQWPQLHEAQRQVLFEVLIRGSQSRVSLARKLGMSRASLSRISRELVDLGLVGEGEVVLRSTRGRPPENLVAQPSAAHLLGVKLTGEALYTVVTDLSGRVVATDERLLPGRDVPTVVELIGEVSDQLLAGQTLPAAAGVCLAGDVRTTDGTEYIDRSIFLEWDAVPIADLVRDRIGLPTVTSNDVQALTAGYHWLGAGAGVRTLVLFGLGAGIGSSFVAMDELQVGGYGRAGRIGHPRVGGVGRPCPRGHVDCVHSFVTIPSIEHNAGVAPGDYPAAVTAARLGEPRAVAAFASAARALGLVVAQVIDIIDPEEVVVTGEGTDLLDLSYGEFEIAVREQLEDGEHPALPVRVLPFEFGHYARGAAITALQHLLR